MTFARRLSAAVLALVLAVLPLAMERCRTACVAPAAETAQAAPAHACHEAAPGEGNAARMDPMARACGHSDPLSYESARLAGAKTRSAVPLPLIEPVPYLHAAVGSAATTWPSVRSDLPPPPLPLNSPLRL